MVPPDHSQTHELRQRPHVAYPVYRIELPDGLMRQCVEAAARLLDEAGFLVGNERFLARVRGRPGIREEGGRVFFSRDLTAEYIKRFTAPARVRLEGPAQPPPPDAQTPWTVSTAGFSMMTLDVATDELRSATCQDLRDYIRLANAFGIGGSYMVMPQDLPPLMRALACFKICWENSANIRPYDYQQPDQLPPLYEMHQAMGQTMDICLTVPGVMTVDPKDLDIFLDYYPLWKRNRDIAFRVLDYPMTGITKPVTVPGCATVCFAETLALHILMNLFDPELELGISLAGGLPTDLRHACWAFGSPRQHLYQYLDSQLLPNLVGRAPSAYVCAHELLATASPAVDAQAALEKMATGLTAALQGCRSFGYAGVLCVDDVYSATQFVIDLEIVEYIRETIEAFSPSPDIVAVEGLYEECLAAARGEDTFLSHPNTVSRFRRLLPSSNLLVREKLRAWMSHHRLLKDRAREVAMERIRAQAQTPFRLPADKQRALDLIYERARARLS